MLLHKYIRQSENCQKVTLKQETMSVQIRKNGVDNKIAARKVDGLRSGGMIANDYKDYYLKIHYKDSDQWH